MPFQSPRESPGIGLSGDLARPHIVSLKETTSPRAPLGVAPLPLDCILASPLSSRSLISWTVGLVDMGDLGNKRIVGIGVCEHRANRQENFGNGQSRTPLVPQDVQADAAVGVDIWVVDASGEVDLGRLEWVVGREVNGEEEDTARVRGFARAHNRGLPVEEVFANGAGGAGRRRVTAEVSELLVDTLKSHLVCFVGGCIRKGVSRDVGAK